MKPDGDATHVLTVVTGSRTSNRLLRAKELALEVRLGEDADAATPGK